MKLKKSSVLGLAAAGVLLASLAVPSFATALRTLVLTTLTATSATITTLTAPTATAATRLRGPSPAAQALSATFTITADACGGVKLVSNAGAAITSDTTNTFTAAASAGVCDMLVVNTGPNEILLDFNTEFPVGAGSAASIRLANGGSIRVYSNGTYWYHGAYTEY